jgi:hypothetical protein
MRYMPLEKGCCMRLSEMTEGEIRLPTHRICMNEYEVSIRHLVCILRRNGCIRIWIRASVTVSSQSGGVVIGGSLRYCTEYLPLYPSQRFSRVEAKGSI